VGRDIEHEFQFNTAIAALMELLNGTKTLDDMPATGAPAVSNPVETEQVRLLGFTLRTLALLLSPFAPHMAEELWKVMGLPGRACSQPWPEFNKAATIEDQVTIAVQVNGKVRATLQAARDSTQEELERLARTDERVAKWLAGKNIRRVIVVPNRLVNIVVG
jgi:leucyl-tRNA synthetase